MLNNINTSHTVYIDTETTGIGDMSEHRIIEIACVKVEDIYCTNNKTIFHHYLDIEDHIQITRGSFRVHGISKDQIKGKPMFHEICDDMLNFIQHCTIIAHNAKFDIDFIDASLERVGKPKITNRVIDSRLVAAKAFPGSKTGIDALVKRFKMQDRKKHSALEDALLLANIYPKLSKRPKLFTTKQDYEKINECNHAFFEGQIE